MTASADRYLVKPLATRRQVDLGGAQPALEDRDSCGRIASAALGDRKAAVAVVELLAGKAGIFRRADVAGAFVDERCTIAAVVRCIGRGQRWYQHDKKAGQNSGPCH